MSFQDFLDKHGVKHIPKELPAAMDANAALLTAACFGPTPTPALGVLSTPVASSVIAATGAKLSDALGLILLVTLLETDITSLIVTSQLLPASVKFKAVPPVPSPPMPVTPTALAVVPVPDPNATRFANAALDWALAQIPAASYVAYGITGPIVLVPI